MHRGLGKAAMEESSATVEQDVSVLLGELETELHALIVRLGGKPVIAAADAPVNRRIEQLVEQMRTVGAAEQPNEHRLRKVA